MIEGKGEGYVTQELTSVKSSGTAAKFRWTVKGLVAAAEGNAVPARIYSDAIDGDGVPWKFLMFPEGNGVRFLSLYLDLANAHSLPARWTREAVFSFTVVSQKNASLSVTNQCDKVYFPGLQDWGFRLFMPLSTLHDEERGFLLNDTLLIDASLSVTPVHEDLGPEDASTPRSGGAVGLCNQGATCYLNSLVQTLFHISYLRNKVFEAPIGDAYDAVSDEEDAEEQAPPPTPGGPREKSLVRALQQVFYHLQFQKKAVSTKELTAAFGWTHEDSFRQHDVHELVRVLCSSLEERWKGTRVAGTLDGLLRGTMSHSIVCQDIQYESTTEESFWDLQLNVRGCSTLGSAFEGYFASEVLDGDNRYSAPGEGLQTAVRKSVIKSAPPVLMLHLKRFDFDLRLQKQTKVNDRQEYPMEIDISPYTEQEGKEAVYTLMSVLVHSGDVNAGHYYAFVYSSALGAWYRFDDERVVRVSERDVMTENFGGDFTGGHITRHPSAYVLTYLRKCDMQWLTPAVSFATLPKGVHRRFGRLSRKELEKEVVDAHLHVHVKILLDKDLVGVSNASEWDVEPRRVLRKSTLSELIDLAFGEGEDAEPGSVHEAPKDTLMLWRWEQKLSKALRPTQLITAGLDSSLEKAFGLAPHHKSTIILSMHYEPSYGDVIGGDEEVATEKEKEKGKENKTPENVSIRKTKWGREQYLSGECVNLLIKMYTNTPDGSCKIKERATVASTLTVGQLYTHYMGGSFSEGSVYEEVRDGCIERLDFFMPLSELELTHGDVLIISQKVDQGGHPFGTELSSTPPAPQDIFGALKQQVLEVTVRFAPKESTDTQPTLVALQYHNTMAEVKRALAAKLGEDAESLEIFEGFADYTPHPNPVPSDVLLHHVLQVGWNKTRKRLYYSIKHGSPQTTPSMPPTLDLTLSAPTDSMCVQVNWISSVHGELQEMLRVSLPRGATVGFLKAHLIETNLILGSQSAVGMPAQFGGEKDASLSITRVRSGAASSQGGGGGLTSPPVSMCGAVRRKSAYQNACSQHPYADRLCLFAMSTTTQSVTQLLWDNFEPVPEDQRGSVLCVEVLLPENVLHPTFTSFEFAPGLSSLVPYHTGFNVNMNRAPRGVHDCFIVQIFHFQMKPVPPGEQTEDEVVEVKPHSTPWLVFVKANDTVKTLRQRIVQERPLYVTPSSAPFF